jgi:hypothetical protein
MEDIKTQRKSRFQKGSQEARDFMAELRSKRGGKTPTPSPAPSPVPSPEPIPPPVAEPKKRSKKNIIVDFS